MVFTMHLKINLRVNRVALHDGCGDSASKGNNGDSGELHFAIERGCFVEY
jgi:hypothetical protein